jgi:hypothetical protein
LPIMRGVVSSDASSIRCITRSSASVTCRAEQQGRQQQGHVIVCGCGVCLSAAPREQLPLMVTDTSPIMTKGQHNQRRGGVLARGRGDVGARCWLSPLGLLGPAA